MDPIRIRHDRDFNGSFSRQVWDDAAIKDNTGFQNTIVVMNDTSNRCRATLSGWSQPLRGRRTGCENVIKLLRKPCTLLLVSGEIVALFAALPAIGEILSEMLVAAGHPVPECQKKPACQRRKLRIVFGFLGPQKRIKIFTGCAVADLQQALEMIDAGAPDFDLLGGQAHDLRNIVLSHEDAVAEPERSNRTIFSERQDDPAFRIGKVDEQCVWTEFPHLAHNIEHQRQGAKRKEQSSRPAIFSQRMTNAMLAGHAEIHLP